MAVNRKSWIGDDDDDYWNETKSRGFDFDNDNLQEAKQIMGGLGDSAGMDEEVINWDGSSACISYEKSARYHPPQSSNAKSSAQPKAAVPHCSSADTLKTTNTHARSSSLGTFHPNSSYLETSGSDPSIDDVVRNSSQSKTPTVTEVAKLQSQINLLKRQKEYVKREKWEALPVEDTVKRIIHGENYSLELYKSKSDKLGLVDAAVAMHDGNAIMAAVLFLRNTIKRSTFNQEMMKRSIACEHYLHYLRLHYDMSELADMLGMLGRSEEAAILKYKQTTETKNPDKKLKNLQTCLNAHFYGDSTLIHHAELVQQQVALLQRQLPVDAADVQAAAQKRHTVLQQHPRAASIVDQPLITTLYYCCFYHYGLTENNLASPQAIKHAHQLTDKQYVTTALRAQARGKRWQAVDALLTTKNWLGKAQYKAPISFEKIVHILLKCDAPRDVLTKFLSLIEDVDTRFQLAKKCKCHSVAVEVLKIQKDRQQLEFYIRKHIDGSRDAIDYRIAQDLLRNSSIKWKN